MTAELLLLAALIVGIVVVALGFARLRARLDVEARQRDALARRVADLERALARPVELPPAARPSPTPVSRSPVPPAEHDYAAAEAELQAQESGDWDTDGDTDRDAGARPSAAAAREVPAATDVPPPRPAGGTPAAPDALPERRPAALSLEDFLGGRVLLVVGVVVVLFALGFFLKLAIERELVPPWARVAIGVLAGLAALGGGDVLRRRGFDPFGHAVMGGGLGALLISTFFAAARYELVGKPPAFALTALIALAGVVLALRREAPLLAYLGFLGGYLAPAILGEGRDALEGLTGWLLVLHLGVLAVVWLRRWPGLDLLALVSSSVYFALWNDRFGAPPRLGAAAWSLAALTAAVLAIALAPGVLRRRPILSTALLTAIVTGAMSVTAGFALFHPVHRYALGGGIVLLGVVYALAARRGVGRVRDVAVDAPVLDGCAVAAAAAAIPTFLEGAALAPAWAVAGAVAVLLAASYRSPTVAAGGLVMIALAQAHLLANHLPMHRGAYMPFANGVFWSWAAPSIATVLAGLALRWRSPWRLLSGLVFGAGAWLYVPVLAMELLFHFVEDKATYGAAYEELSAAAVAGAVGGYALLLALLARRRRPAAILLPLGPLAVASLFTLVVVLLMDRHGYVPLANAPFLAGALVVAAWWTTTLAARGALRAVLLVGAVLAGLLLLGGECVAYGENASVVGTSREALERVAQVWMSVAFAVYAAALLVLGFARRTPALRWSGLAIFLLTLGKVFLVDMATLPTAHRIGGFLVLGILLLAASFLYQRARRDVQA